MRPTAPPGRHRARRRITLAAFVAFTLAASVAMVGSASAEDGGVSDAPILGIWEVQSLSGRNNNLLVDPNFGRAGQTYIRVVDSRYADGISQMVGGPNARNVSNRTFNDSHQNLFSERGVSQWGFVWGQFLDHTFGLRDEAGETANIPFSSTDPLEEFTNTLGIIPFVRSKGVPGPTTGRRQQINTVSSFIEASAVYGDTDTRLDWLREGSVDGNPDNNGARLLMPSNYLPRRDTRGNPAAAPTMAVDGRLLATPNRAMVAGDVRANENIALTATHTLFAREHNRIVSLLPSWVSQQDKFQLARAVVIAEQQYITYNQFLPAVGVNLPSYQGYNPFVNPTLGNEFATVGYRAHSMIHGELETETNVSRYTAANIAALEAQGVEVEVDGADAELVVPLNVAFFNPDLVPLIQLGPVLKGIGLEAQYKNDEMIDNQLRSVLFQVPVPGNTECLDGPTLPECFRGVVDLGAIDIQRGRDHGIPSYNTLRAAYGLPAKSTFTSITGETTETLPTGLTINSPSILDFTALFDVDGNPIPLGSPEAESSAVRGVRRSTTAARLKAVYGSTSNLDAFTGMVAEKHLSGSEFGELQLAIWKKQFAALRDGDRFFYANDPLQTFIRQNFGIDSRKTLAQVIAANTDTPLADLEANVFLAPSEGLAAASLSGGPTDKATGGVTDGTISAVPPATDTRHGGPTAASVPGRAVGMAAGMLTGIIAARRARRGNRAERRRRPIR